MIETKPVLILVISICLSIGTKLLFEKIISLTRQGRDFLKETTKEIEKLQYKMRVEASKEDLEWANKIHREKMKEENETLKMKAKIEEKKE